MMDLSNLFSQLFGWFNPAEFRDMLPAADTSVAGVIGAVLLGVWVLTKVMRVLVGTLCVVCLLYLALRLGLGIAPLPYLLS